MPERNKSTPGTREGDAATGLCVFNVTRQSFLSLGIEVLPARFGLWRRLVPAERSWHNGTWLVPCRWIHTIGLRHPVDVVYLGPELRVLHVIEQLLPFRVPPLRRGTHSILELPERTLYWSNTAPGDQLLICPASDLAEQWARAIKERVLN
ncbi:MAG: hypothetical protein K6T61_13205 [Bryobacteraceae bacterium]|nr:hypothetical protein [Bryobacteraceae bacterium]